jgi:hypothetical protein
MKHTFLSLAILFSMAGMTAVQAETPDVPQMPAITVSPAISDIPAITVAPAETGIPAVTVAPAETVTPTTPPVPVEAAAAATTVAPEAKVAATQTDASDATASTPDTTVTAGEGTGASGPMPGKGRCKDGMKHRHGGMKHGMGCNMEHRRQMKERLDIIDARLAKIEAMLEILMRR